MRILGEHIDPAANLRYSLRRYAPWWLLLLATAVFDFVTTLGFIARLGIEAEANPVARWLILSLGACQGLLTAKVLQLFAVAAITALNRRLGGLFLIVVVLLNIWAVVINSL